MINYLIFNGQSSDVFGMVISGSGTYNAPKRKYDTFTVPGRNGTLKIDGGSFENISVTYTAAIVHNLNSNAAALREWLLSPSGYCRLEDTYHPGEFRLAQFSGGVEFSDFSQFLRAASFNLTFDCKPQRFLKAGENPISNPATVYNPTSFSAKPMIKFTAAAKSGNVVIGNCTKASPANTTRPILSFVKLSTRFSTSIFDLSRREGNTSSANIELEMSRHIIVSMPLRFSLLIFEPI